MKPEELWNILSNIQFGCDDPDITGVPKHSGFTFIAAEVSLFLTFTGLSADSDFLKLFQNEQILLGKRIPYEPEPKKASLEELRMLFKIYGIPIPNELRTQQEEPIISRKREEPKKALEEQIKSLEEQILKTDEKMTNLRMSLRNDKRIIILETVIILMVAILAVLVYKSMH